MHFLCDNLLARDCFHLVQVPTDIPVPASGNMDIDALAAALAKAIQQSNTAPTVKALGVLAELLKNIDTNTKTPGKTVKM